MAIFILKDASVTVNSVSLSEYVSSITLDYAVESIVTDSMGSNGHTFIAGLQNNSVTMTMNQDFAATKVAATLDALVGTSTTVVIKPTSAIVGATNPSYTLTNTFLAAVQPVNGSVGDLASMSVTFTGGTIAKVVI